MLHLRRTLTLLVCLLLGHAVAHESCCKHKLKQVEPEFIPDPDDNDPPSTFESQPRFVDDPNDVKPSTWDDDEDGEWGPVQIENPNYNWRPRQLRNPKYVPPPTFSDKWLVEVRAAVPWVTLGVLMTGLLSGSWFQFPFLEKLLVPDTSGGQENIVLALFRPFLAALLGLATPLCSCGALPLAAGLIYQGVPLSLAFAFLTASQSAGLDSFAITWGILGPSAAVARLMGAIVLALAVYVACPNTSPTTKSASKANGAGGCSSNHHPGFVSTLLQSANEIFPTVLLGLTISTAVLHYLPNIFMTTSMEGYQIGNDIVIPPWMVRWGLLLSAVPIQLCEHTAVTLAATMQKAGSSPGFAFAFLLSAPATNLPSLLWVLNHAGSSMGVARVVVALSVTGWALSYAIDTAQLDFLAGQTAGDSAVLPSWYRVVSPYLAGGLWLSAIVNKLTTKPKSSCSTTCSGSNNKAKVE